MAELPEPPKFYYALKDNQCPEVEYHHRRMTPDEFVHMKIAEQGAAERKRIPDPQWRVLARIRDGDYRPLEWFLWNTDNQLFDGSTVTDVRPDELRVVESPCNDDEAVKLIEQAKARKC